MVDDQPHQILCAECGVAVVGFTDNPDSKVEALCVTCAPVVLKRERDQAAARAKAVADAKKRWLLRQV